MQFEENIRAEQGGEPLHEHWTLDIVNKRLGLHWINFVSEGPIEVHFRLEEVSIPHGVWVIGSHAKDRGLNCEKSICAHCDVD